MDEGLKKQVLTDCGHRCVICGTSCTIDQVNIILLDEAKDEVPNNLICLCARCYKRTKEETWDEERLKEFKTRPWLQRQYEGVPLLIEPRGTVVLTLNTGLRYFSERDREYLQSAISGFLEIDPREVQVKRVEGDPLEINVELPADNVDKIIKSFAEKDSKLARFLSPLTFTKIIKKNVAMRWLTETELAAFRQDYRELERETQSFFRAYYLSGLILVAAWLFGQQSKPLLELSIGNGGYNIYALLGITLLNMASTTYLLHKSIAIHEVTQFITYLGKPDSVFNYWESWRRSPQNYGKRGHPFYYIMITVLPFCVSGLILYHASYVLFTDSKVLLTKIKEHQIPQQSPIFAPSTAAQSESQLDAEKILEREAEAKLKGEQNAYAERLVSVFWWAKILFWLVLIAHVMPLIMAVINSYNQGKRWNEINKLRGWSQLFQDLTLNPATIEVTTAGDKRVVIYSKDADRFTRELTEGELVALIERIKDKPQQKR